MPTGIRSHTGGVSTSPVSQVKMPSLLHVFVFVTATPSASLSAADGGPHGYPCSRPRAVDARPLLVTSAVCASSLLTRGCLSLLLYLHHMFRVKMALHIYGAQLLSLLLHVFCHACLLENVYQLSASSTGLPSTVSATWSTAVCKFRMENSRKKQFISFKLHII